MTKQHGFTLIELLVVIAIIGVLVAVVVLNIGNLIGIGSVEAANAEMHQVATAAISYMAIGGGNFEAVIGPEDNYPINATADEGVHMFITNPGVLQAIYTVRNGAVIGATPIEDSKWRDLWFCEGEWQEEQCPE